MGEPVTVIERQTSVPGVIRFQINRSVSGTGHEVFRSAADAQAQTPSAKLARALFEQGGIQAVHIYGNIITVHLASGQTGAALKPIIESLYIFYKEGVEVAYPA